MEVMMMSKTGLLFILSLTVLTAISERNIIPAITFSRDNLRNMVVDEDNGVLYLGGDSVLYRLNTDNLSILSLINYTCDSCYSKILLKTNNNNLITCDIDGNGTCALYNASDLTRVSLNNSNSGLYIFGDRSKTAVGLLNSNGEDLYVGLTYDRITEDYLPYHIIANRATDSTDAFNYIETNESGVFVPRLLNIKKHLKKIYPFYFRAAFQTEKHVYFLTNQKFQNNIDSPYVSKLIRICKDDYGFYSYIDLELECTNESGEKFNFVQHGSLIELGDKLSTSQKDQVLVATFAAGCDPEKPFSKKSAICLYTLQQIQEVLLKAQTKIVSTCDEDGKLVYDESERYIDRNGLPSRPPCQNESFVMEYLNCTKFESYGFLTSFDTKLNSTAIFTTSKYLLGKISGNSLEEGNSELLVGTSTGYLLKIVLSDNTPTRYHEIYDIGSLHPVEAIHRGKDVDYILTREKVVKVIADRCLKYLTCDECKTSNNRNCGWCILEEKCSERKFCSAIGDNTWIQAKCISQNTTPKAGIINANVKLKINLSPLPSAENGTYTCVFRTDGDYVYSDAEKSDNETLYCTSPIIKEQKEAKLEIYMTLQQKTLKLTSNLFLFYDCLKFASCRSCTSESAGGCNWCVSNTTAMCSSNGSCSTKYTYREENNCPQLDTSSLHSATHLVYVGVPYHFIFKARNLPDVGVYTCNPRGISNIPAVINRTSDVMLVTCTVLIERIRSITYVIEISLMYPNNQPVDGSYEDNVFVQDCPEMAQKCHMCEKISSLCRWCNNSQFSNIGCFHSSFCTNDSVPCAGPAISSIEPTDGPIGGGTVVTIKKKDMELFTGATIDITVAGIPCKLLTKEFPFDDLLLYLSHLISRYIYLDTDSIEELRIELQRLEQLSIYIKRLEKLSEVSCIPMPSIDEVNGPFIIRVFNKSYQYGNFTFKNPKIANVLPTTGPMAGGTHITISGTNLVSGNKEINVTLFDGIREQSCKISNIWSKDIDEIICETQAVENIQNVSILVTFDRFTSRTVSQQFLYLENPVIKSFLHNESIATGGIKLRITGEYLNNANYVGIRLVENGTSFVPCKLESDSKMVCKTPELSEEKKKLIQVKSNVTNREERSIVLCSGCFEVCIKMDGIESTFTIAYTGDPTILNLTGKKSVYSFNPRESRTITIKGSNLLWDKDDINIFIGYGKCLLVEVSESSISCTPPEEQPGSDDIYPPVSVQIGNFKKTIGYLKYENLATDKNETLSVTVIIVIAVTSGLAGALLLALLLVACNHLKKSLHQRREMQELIKKMNNYEMEIKKYRRAELAEEMAGSNISTSSLVEESKFPYRDYQYYSFQMLFPTADMKTHTVLLNLQVSDDMKNTFKNGIDMLEDLLYNKCFLRSLIQTLERQPQKTFSQKERDDFSSVLSVVLLEHMEYFHEIVKILLPDVVQELVKRKAHKGLFIRCESVTEKLMRNLLSLCLYPHLKKHGSSMSIMLKAIEDQKDKGSTDQLTGENKSTFSKHQLNLKQPASESELSSILPDIKKYFDSILDAKRAPKLVKSLYDQLDNLADSHRVADNTLYSWKSHSYPIHFWGSLTTKPDVVFVINKFEYTNQCLEIVRQTFIDIFTTTSKNKTKESATHKLMSIPEMDEYRGKAKKFFSDVKFGINFTNADFQQSFKQIDKEQNKELTYKKISALYEIFKVIDKFMVDVIDDLQKIPEARTLQLSDHLDVLVGMIKESEADTVNTYFAN